MKLSIYIINTIDSSFSGLVVEIIVKAHAHYLVVHHPWTRKQRTTRKKTSISPHVIYVVTGFLRPT